MESLDRYIVFMREHANDDLNRLLLSASRYPDVDIAFVVDQISSRRQIKDKLPSWYANDRLVFPSRISAEQCSSEQTAIYKQRLVREDEHLCDLTGGLGIDSYFFSRKVRKVTYIERFSEYCEAAKRNFSIIGADNVEVKNGDSVELINTIYNVDTFYIDPARRGEGNRRVFALHDCEPDLIKLLPLLHQHAAKVIAKISPMADIRQTLELMPSSTEVHVVSVRNECKELLFVMERGCESTVPNIHCVNFASGDVEESFSFTIDEERDCGLSLAGGVGKYLYEPNASILKAGAFKVTASRWGLMKLHVSSHLYTGDMLIDGFPGRRFAVDEVIEFNNRSCKGLSKRIPRANITTRNFPISVDELRKRLKLADGGDTYLFATTLATGDRVLLCCHKI